jgi:tetratricopeptide (TPR) repeat protein
MSQRVLEGSVRRSEHTVRITAQLVNGVTGFHLWSQTYDRDLGEVLALQTEIAIAVASALKVTLLGDMAAKIELGGTHNPAAFDEYLRGSKLYSTRHEANDVQSAVAAYTEAIRLDSDYALAFVARSIAFSELAGWWGSKPAAIRQRFDKALADGRKGMSLAPELSEAHLALADALAAVLDFTRANEEYERAVALAPGSARVLQRYGLFAVLMGHIDVGIAAARRAVQLDPLNRDSHGDLGLTLLNACLYDEANAALEEALALDPEFSPADAYLGLNWYSVGNFQGALSSCQARTESFFYCRVCLAVTYEKLGRHADAEAELAKLKSSSGDGLRTNMPRSMRSGEILPRHSVGWIRRCGCVIRDWNTLKQTTSLIRCVRSHVSRPLSGNSSSHPSSHPDAVAQRWLKWVASDEESVFWRSCDAAYRYPWSGRIGGRPCFRKVVTLP